MPASIRSGWLILVVAMLFLHGVHAPSGARAQNPLLDIWRDWTYYADPGVKAELAGFQAGFEGEIQASAMLPLQPGAREHTIQSVPLRDAPSLTDLLHDAWRSEAAGSCPDVVRLIEQQIQAKVASARLVDVQCFINPLAVSGARLAPGGLQYKLLNRSNRVAFTIGGVNFAPRYILHFGLKAEIDLELSRGAPTEQGQVLKVTRAQLKTRAVRVDSGNFAGHLAGGPRQQLADGASRMTMNLTGKLQGRVDRSTKSFLRRLPGLATVGPVYFRSRMTDNSLRTGVFPVLVLVGRPHLAPFDLKATVRTFAMDLEGSLPGTRPVDLKHVELLESGQLKARLSAFYNWFRHHDPQPASRQQLTYQACTINEFDERACAPPISVRAIDLIRRDAPTAP